MRVLNCYNIKDVTSLCELVRRRSDIGVLNLNNFQPPVKLPQ
jgi:hypothetical protein